MSTRFLIRSAAAACGLAAIVAGSARTSAGPPPRPGGELRAASSRSFGDVPVGETKERSLLVRNRSTRQNLIVTVQPLEPPFRVSRAGKTFAIRPGRAVRLRLRFQPEAAGPAEATLHLFTTDRERSRWRVSLTGNGT